MGENLPTGGFRMAADKNLGKRVSVGVNAGMKFREKVVFQDLNSASQFTTGTAASVKIGKGFSGKAELASTTAMNQFYENKVGSPLEFLFGGNKSFEKAGINVGLGTGLALVRGAGTPLFRTFLGIAYTGNRPTPFLP